MTKYYLKSFSKAKDSIECLNDTVTIQGIPEELWNDLRETNSKPVVNCGFVKGLCVVSGPEDSIYSLGFWPIPIVCLTELGIKQINTVELR